MSTPPNKKITVKKSPPNSARKNKKEQQHIKILENDYILIEPDRPDIWSKAGFRREYNLGPKRIYEKFEIDENGKMAWFSNAPKNSKFKKTNELIFIPRNKINLHTLYNAEGESEYYSASFFGGEIATQLIPLFELPKFLEEQIKIDNELGKFYDLINIRENGRAMWGAGDEYSGLTFRNMAESAEELLLRLNEYKRKGALIGEGGSFEYIQVCYIILEG